MIDHKYSVISKMETTEILAEIQQLCDDFERIVKDNDIIDGLEFPKEP
jgi:hypothetical protein